MTRRYNYEYTYLRIGGGVITDATATPDLVADGEIFYNNDGRQIGINTTVTKKLQTMILTCKDGSYTLNTSLIPSVGATSITHVLSVSGESEPYTLTIRNSSDSYVLLSTVRIPEFSHGDIRNYGFIFATLAGATACDNVYQLIVNGTRYVIGTGFATNGGSAQYSILTRNIGSGTLHTTGSSSQSISASVYPIFGHANGSITGIYLGAFIKSEQLSHTKPTFNTSIEIKNVAPITFSRWVNR